MQLLTFLFIGFAVLALGYGMLEGRDDAMDNKPLVQRGASNEESCPREFERFEDSCYYFSKPKLSFHDALKFCYMNGYGTRLVEINSEKEKNYLKGILRQKDPGNYWIGLADIYAEGTFVWWTSGKQLSGGNVTDFGPTEPNGGKSENCVLLDTEQKYKWADFPCAYKYNFICKKSICILLKRFGMRCLMEPVDDCCLF